MSKDLFDTDEKAMEAISLFGNLIDNEGWKLHVKVMQANIDVLTEGILNGGVPEKQLNLLRMKREALKECIGNPQKQIKDLSPTEVVDDDNPDPYEIPIKKKLDNQ